MEYDVQIYRTYNAESNHTVKASSLEEAKKLALTLDSDTNLSNLIDVTENIEDRQICYCGLDE